MDVTEAFTRMLSKWSTRFIAIVQQNCVFFPAQFPWQALWFWMLNVGQRQQQQQQHCENNLCSAIWASYAVAFAAFGTSLSVRYIPLAGNWSSKCNENRLHLGCICPHAVLYMYINVNVCHYVDCAIHNVYAVKIKLYCIKCIVHIFISP